MSNYFIVELLPLFLSSFIEGNGESLEDVFFIMKSLNKYIYRGNNFENWSNMRNIRELHFIDYVGLVSLYKSYA